MEQFSSYLFHFLFQTNSLFQLGLEQTLKASIVHRRFSRIERKIRRHRKTL